MLLAKVLCVPVGQVQPNCRGILRFGRGILGLDVILLPWWGHDATMNALGETLVMCLVHVVGEAV